MHHFFAADFAHDDPVRPHPQAAPHQVGHVDAAPSLDIGASAFQTDDVADVIQLELRGILDDDDPLVRRNGPGQHIQKGCLAAGGPAGHEAVVAGPHQPLQELGGFRRNGSAVDEVLHAHGRACRKLPDGQYRPAQRDAGQNSIDPGTVRQARVHDGVQFVDLSVDPGSDPADQLFQFCRGIKGKVGLFQAAVPFDEDPVRSVDHDFRDAAVIGQRLEDSQFPAQDQEQFLHQGAVFLPGPAGSPGMMEDIVLDQAEGPLICKTFGLFVHDLADPGEILLQLL